MVGSAKGSIYTRKGAKECLGCGLPTNSIYGYCARNPECKAAQNRGWYHSSNQEAKRAYLPDMSDRPCYCLTCGKKLRRGYHVTYVCKTTPKCRSNASMLWQLLRRLKVNENA